MKNKIIGSLGERIAADYLLKKGYKILTHNFFTKYGELDIIGVLNNTLVFFEVKTRIGIKKGQPYESVNYYKLKHLKRAIDYFLLTKGFKDYKLRLDVLTVLLEQDNKIKEIKHFENVEI